MMQIKKLSPLVGAEVIGVDASQAMSNEDVETLKSALCHNGMLVIRNQSLTPQQLVDFSQRLGPSERYDGVGHEYLLPGYPDIISISNVVENGKFIGVREAGTYWHTDGSFHERPAWASVLYALEVPHDDAGQPLGETMFASMSAAYDALSPADKERLKGISALHQYVYRSHQQKEGQTPPSAVRPAVINHPVTGKPLIFLNRGFTNRILDLPEQEATELFHRICDHATQSDFRHVHRWKVGDVVIWDNYAVQHNAVSNYGERRRRMWRTTVRGFPWRDGAFVAD